MSAETRLRETLLSHQNSDGGWGYYPARQSSLEPTVFGVLALAGVPAGQAGVPAGQAGVPADQAGVPAADAGFRAARRWLQSQRLGSGAFSLFAGDEPSTWGTALAIVGVYRTGTDRSSLDPSVSWLLAQSGQPIEVLPQKRKVTRMDSTLRGWPWYGKTFSWVEPTSYALLAIKMLGRGDHPRVAEAERLLFDRQCDGGGWNYGNPDVLGERIEPIVSSTALVLLALQDRKDDPRLAEARGFLSSQGAALSWPPDLAWILLALRCYPETTETVESRLREALSAFFERPAGDPLETNLAALGLCLLALRGDDHPLYLSER